MNLLEQLKKFEKENKNELVVNDMFQVLLFIEIKEESDDIYYRVQAANGFIYLQAIYIHLTLLDRTNNSYKWIKTRFLESIERKGSLYLPEYSKGFLDVSQTKLDMSELT